MAAISTQQNSLELLLWPQPVNNVCRQFPQLNLLLLPHRLPLPSHSLPIRRCFHLPATPLPPLLRRRLLPLCSPMSSLNSDHNSPAAKTVRVVVKGRVQGVFYRNWTIENAIELGLKGWVRNRRDGSVEALFSGKPEKVEEMEQRCTRGPPHAMVTCFLVFPSTDDPGTSFERKPTL
ncbi:hypothetical protein ABFS82_12G142900 [Erythranthe guttata]|uniref:acylphosphatase n=1 Tax=Erythranthe guttata TaxID=4155 RepID=A0A022RFM3_ERYGU|nr:PREDICTED: uncharacterized protein LOC105956552 [Erythranthe guttata]EYU38558.1 hypothetical protein MIMGU_mgv1a014847mg [Erythranthe guttata]|eukprot:XP_012835856.1 PREDICTED: uncharacterized protein LOC105956552 [Erythranthe guttata]